MSIRNIIVQCSFLILVCAPCFAAAPVSSFTTLPKDSKLVIRYSSQGCFHGFTYELNFTPSGAGLFEVYEIPTAWSEAEKKTVEFPRQWLGVVMLEAGDIGKLDALLAFYRSNTKNGCTTVDTIQIKEMRGEVVVAEEKFVDGSCSADEKPEMLTFWHFVCAFKKAKK